MNLRRLILLFAIGIVIPLMGCRENDGVYDIIDSNPPQIIIYSLTPNPVKAGKSSVITFTASGMGLQIYWSARLVNGGGGSIHPDSGGPDDIYNNYASITFDTKRPAFATVVIEAWDLAGLRAKKSVEIQVVD